MDRDPAMAAVEAWLHDISLPCPPAADLAAYVAHDESMSRFAGAGARAALLRTARMVVAYDGFLKDAQARAERYASAVKDASRTAVVAIERLQKQEPLVKAAVRWYQCDVVQLPSALADLRQAVEGQIKIQAVRS